MFPDSSDKVLTVRQLTWIALIALIHCAVWFGIYGSTALGESPALDNRQTLELARTMAESTLAQEPFHRAPLYPFCLSIFLRLGLPFELLHIAARLLNALALALIAVSVAYTATRMWRNKAAGWIAGLLVALNPVLLFFAGDAFDILLATAAFALALPFLLRWLKQPNLHDSLYVALLLTIGSALRSHLLPLALLWPVAVLIFARGQRLSQLCATALPVFISFVLLGLANLSVCGEFRMLPWQGAYNLWAGNGPDANGRIYAQQIRVEFANGYDNPAKLESIALYEQETGSTPPHSISAMGKHWKAKFFEHITNHPIDWLGLMLRKSYFFLNSYEQYDNKTYGFHKQRHVLLRLNPIHWGGLLLLAVTGTLLGLKNQATRRICITLIIVFAAYAAGTILFYTSNRFRVPMIPVLTLLVPGAWILIKELLHPSIDKLLTVIVASCLLITVLVAYTDFFNARDKDTWEEDYALLANASLRTGRDADAALYAAEALKMNPARNDMSAVFAQAGFNRWALNDSMTHISIDEAQHLKVLSEKGIESDPLLRPLIGIYQWKLGYRDEAVRVWQDIANEDALALLCLHWTGHAPTPSVETLNTLSTHPAHAILISAIREKDDSSVAIFMERLLRDALPHEEL